MLKQRAIREPTSCITRRFEACWRADHSDHAQKRHLIREGIEADELCAIEHQRLQALVEADMTVAGSLHSEDFQHLGAVASGEIDYLLWEPEAIEGYARAARWPCEMALVRYTSRLELVAGGQGMPLRHYWHTDFYERREGHCGRPCGRERRRR